LLVVGLEVGVDAIRNFGAGVAEPAGDGDDGHASRDEAGTEVVPQRVRRHGEAHSALDDVESVSGDGFRERASAAAAEHQAVTSGPPADLLGEGAQDGVVAGNVAAG
jgi:hypothetical protein